MGSCYKAWDNLKVVNILPHLRGKLPQIALLPSLADTVASPLSTSRQRPHAIDRPFSCIYLGLQRVKQHTLGCRNFPMSNALKRE